MFSKSWLWIGVLAALFFSLLFLAGVFSNLQLKLADNLYGGRQPLDSVVIVAIDDKSLQELGRWPWPRTHFSKLVSVLNRAKVVGIDVAFFEPTADDAEFAKTISLAGNVVLPVEYIAFSSENGRLVGRQLLLPVGDLKSAPQALGYINIITDKDGVTRALNLEVQGEYKNFAAVLYGSFWKKPFDKPSSRFLINFVGKPASFPYLSFSDVITGKIQPDFFKDKLVLVGSTSPDLHDDYFVPTSGGKAMPGVEIHTNALQTMIAQRFLSPSPSYVTVGLIFLFSLLISFLIHRLHIVWSGILSLVFILLYVFATVLFFDKGFILNILYPPLAILGAFIPNLAYHYVFEKKEKKKAVGAFSKYLSPILVDELLKHPEKLKLGGERRRITVFFSDVRGFTSISEKLSPEDLVKLLNKYLSSMTDIILKNNGLVDKYIGDAIMAFWGAPLDEPQHPYLSCLTACEMKHALKELQEKWRVEGFPKIDIGVGLNTGDAVVGNMGSSERFDYTAMGDTVNLASRLESLTKQYGVMILISHSTQQQVHRDFVTREIDLVAVKGKKEPVAIYELVDKIGDVPDKELQLIDDFEAGLRLYQKKKWPLAIVEFEKALKLRPDKASEVFIDRCKALQKSAPPDWNGVWVMTEK